MVSLLLAVAVITSFFLLRSSEPENVSNPSSVTPPPEVSLVGPPKLIDSPKPVVISSLLPQQFIVLDLETTGLNPLVDEIIEFGAIHVSLDSDTHKSFQTLVKPKRKVPRKITEITGITQEMVDTEGIELIDALTEFIEFIGDLPIVTYNAEFDMGFIHNAARGQGIIINNRYACALKRARRAWPTLPSHRLAYLAEVGGLPNDDAHRALGDCMRALTVFVSATTILNQKVRWSKPPAEFATQLKVDAPSGNS